MTDEKIEYGPIILLLITTLTLIIFEILYMFREIIYFNYGLFNLSNFLSCMHQIYIISQWWLLVSYIFGTECGLLLMCGDSKSLNRNINSAILYIINVFFFPIGLYNMYKYIGSDIIIFEGL